MSYTDDPGHDAYMRDMEHESWLSGRPICYLCREPIQTEKYVRIQNTNFCMQCIYENTHYVED